MVDSERIERENRQLRSRLKNARIGQPAACIEDIEWAPHRSLDRSYFTTLTLLQWLRLRRNLLFFGPTGTGKTYLACALGQKACRDGFTVQYERAPRLFKQLGEARIMGTHASLLASIAKKDLLIIDDFGLKPLNEEARLDLLEIMEDRYEKRSTIVTSQRPQEQWYDTIGDPTIADAILDRLVHNAHTVELKGESIRKAKGKKDLDNQE